MEFKGSETLKMRSLSVHLNWLPQAADEVVASGSFPESDKGSGVSLPNSQVSKIDCFIPSRKRSIPAIYKNRDSSSTNSLSMGCHSSLGCL
ncbi:hypothetical protein CCACVL1_03366 [Corchorus capsularis]|uniref:Uncharacterized protein n=1 Tax=Corchorus capsularis TaxID=210143 RepID=A0A1R3JZW5_COCAP|nr:hypothetical protein CCACVL1_03366 [Corchorus capsularis]